MARIADHDFSRCPHCAGEMVPAQSWTGESKFWLRCSRPDCRVFVNTYVPQPHQRLFHGDTHRMCGNFGGYGSGKTQTSIAEAEKHILITDGGTGLIGANVTSQYEQTFKRDFEADFPREFVKHYNNQKSYVDFENNYRLIYRPFDDADKLRSYNVDLWVILEASEVKDEIFTQLKTRLRNMAAAVPEEDEDGNPIFTRGADGEMVPVYKADWRKGIVESNPSAGWIKSEVLNVSDVIHKHGDIHEEYIVLEEERDPYISTHVTATSANKYLPHDFIPMQSRNKPRWWVERFIHGSFLYSDGLVYPSLAKHICQTFDPPRSWKRIVAHDYGLADPSCFLFGAIDEMNNILYIYKEIYTNDRNVEELAKLFFGGIKDIPVGGWVCPPIIDPKSGPRRDYNKRTLSDLYSDYGISFMPGQVNREMRVFRTNTYLEAGKVRIMDTCKNLISQGRELKFKQDGGSTTKPWKNEPEDKDDHAVVCLEWILCELPKDPNKLVWGAYNHHGEMLREADPMEAIRERETSWANIALADSSGGLEENYYEMVI